MTKKELIYILETQKACQTWVDELKRDSRTPEEIWNNPQVPGRKYVYPLYWVTRGPTGAYKAKIEKSLSIKQYGDPGLHPVDWKIVKEILETDCLLYYACPDYLEEIKWYQW